MRPRVRRGMPAGTGKSRAREKKYRLLSADEALKKALLPENGCSHMYGDVRV